MPRLITSEDHEQGSSTTKPFGRQRPLHELLGRGEAANILLWRDYRKSAAILMGFTVMWFLFEVAEYHLITLLCYIFIIAMLVIFIWYNGTALLEIDSPKIPAYNLSGRAEEVALAFHDKLVWFMSKLYDLAHGGDLKHFILAIAFLWLLSVIGSYCSSLNLLYFGILCMFILPAVYEHYEGEVDHLARQGSRDLEKLYSKFNTKVLNKIPRTPVGEKKSK